ncbi:MAG: alpha/beta hydrolase [Rhizobiales bacterium]|nr:alpha/beta hydrolase [Hyphomicrobiales bacterium]
MQREVAIRSRFLNEIPLCYGRWKFRQIGVSGKLAMHGTSARNIPPLPAAPAAEKAGERPAEAGRPVTFAGTVGLYTPADARVQASDTAVLFVGSWGFEELCARKFWRLLAEDLGRQGIASLRFDFPGTGDALDPEDCSAGLDIWLQSIASAAAALRDLSGGRRLLLVGHGIGAALAWRAAEMIDDVAGIAMAAPATSGRRWVREFMALSRIADHGAIKHATSPGGPAMGEQTIPDAILAGIRALDISRTDKPAAPEVLVLSPEGRADAAFLDHLGSLGVQVRTAPFEGYDLFVRDVLLSIPPRAAIGRLVDWACGLKGTQTPAAPAFPESRPLAGDGFTETPVRFGEGERLYGVLCEPQGPRRGATVMMLSTGYDRMWPDHHPHLPGPRARGHSGLPFRLRQCRGQPALPAGARAGHVQRKPRQRCRRGAGRPGGARALAGRPDRPLQRRLHRLQKRDPLRGGQGRRSRQSVRLRLGTGYGRRCPHQRVAPAARQLWRENAQRRILETGPARGSQCGAGRAQPVADDPCQRHRDRIAASCALPVPVAQRDRGGTRFQGRRRERDAGIADL